MKTITSLFFLLLGYVCTFAQGGPYLFAGAGNMANGEIGLLARDAEAAIVLPALLADRTSGGWTAGISKRSGLGDLTEVSGAAHLKLPWKDQVAVSFQHAGIEGYREQRFTLSYARKLFEQLDIAAQFEFDHNSVEEYEPLNAFTWGLSIHAPLMDKLSLSAYVYNPLGDETDLDLPSLVRAGICYKPSSKLDVAMEVEKDWRHDVRIKAGFNYYPHPRLGISWGAGTNPGLVHAGLVWNLFGNFDLKGAWRYHNKLGSSFAASVGQHPKV